MAPSKQSIWNECLVNSFRNLTGEMDLHLALFKLPNILIPAMRPLDHKDVSNILERKFDDQMWFQKAQSYLTRRYEAIEERMFDAFRYVEPEPENRQTFSYEFASIIRDCGSVFSSTLDTFVRETRFSPKTDPRQFNINDYRSFLNEKLKKQCKVFNVSLQIDVPEASFILPLAELSSNYNILPWWDAYNGLKHSEIGKVKEGNFENALAGLGSLAILYHLMDKYAEDRIYLFPDVGEHSPADRLRSLLFFKE